MNKKHENMYKRNFDSLHKNKNLLSNFLNLK